MTAPPTDFHLVWRALGRTPVTLWAPVPPPGYRTLGAVATAALEMPTREDVLCVREDRCAPAPVFDSPAWGWEPVQVRQPPLPRWLLTLLPCLWPLCGLCGQVPLPATTFLAALNLEP